MVYDTKASRRGLEIECLAKIALHCSVNHAARLGGQNTNEVEHLGVSSPRNSLR